MFDWVLNMALEINLEIYQKMLVLTLFMKEYQVGLRPAYNLRTAKISI